jgi:alpha-L-fucosidase 2
MGAYQNFGDVFISLDRASSNTVEASQYRRELDLSRAVHRVAYTSGEVQFSRETFCSHPAGVLVSRLTANKPGQYSGSITLKDAHDATAQAGDRRLRIAGALPNGLKYAAQLHVQNSGGRLRAEGDKLVFSDCDSLVLRLAADTNYVMDYGRNWRGDPPSGRVNVQIAAAVALSYDTLLSKHVADHQSLFSRVALDVGKTSPERTSLPLDERIKAYKTDPNDPGLEAMLFQFGRYLMIACSRPGTLPANLQGLWNNSNDPPWKSDYHTNINVQMNYWLVEPANLAECHEPLIELTKAMSEPSRKATRASFGNVRGFTYRTSHNIFGGLGWEWNIPGSAWYCQHVWEHYAFGGDKRYLRETAYPILKEVVTFWEDHLKKLPDGTLVSPNGWSPEHGPREDGVAHDQQIVWDLFTNYIQAADALGVDKTYRDKVAAMREKLDGPRIGKWGQLQEWREDRDDPKDEHRHTSHLFAVYPGRQISVTQTPDLAKAAAVSLKARGETGDSRRSWTWPWRCALWARFRQGEDCHRMIRGLLQYNMQPNLLATHPPMQMDGSFGITAGMCEMLVQSQAGEIHLLPALPKAWPEGKVTGLRARGGFTVDVEWKNGQLTAATLRATQDAPCRIRTGGPMNIKARSAGAIKVKRVDDVMVFPARAGESYSLSRP